MHRIPPMALASILSLFAAGCPARDVRPDPVPEPAAPPAPTVPELVDALFDDGDLSGDVERMMQTTLTFYATLLALLPESAKEARRVADARLESVVDADALVAVARAHVEAHGDIERLGAVVDFNATEAGSRWVEAMGRMQAEAEEPEDWLDAFYRDLDGSEEAQARLARVRELEAVTGHGRLAMEMVTTLAGLFLDGFDRLPEPIRPAPEHVASVRANVKAAMDAPMMDELLLGSYLFATRDMSVAQIEAVIAFHESGPGAWWVEVVTGSLLTAAEAFVDLLVDNLAGAWTEAQAAG